MTGQRVHVELFGCEGGSAHGYAQAFGNDRAVWSVDDAPARHALNPYGWFLGDWKEGLARALATGQVVSVGASPPCHVNTRGTAAIDRSKYPDLIAPVREALIATGLPYIIENVEDAKRKMISPLLLCGTEFNLTARDTNRMPLWLRRHRLFESNVMLFNNGGCAHPKDKRCAGVYGGARRDSEEARLIRKGGYVPKDLGVLRQLLGAPAWMSEQGMFLSIPPVYTRHLGEQLLAHSRCETQGKVTA